MPKSSKKQIHCIILIPESRDSKTWISQTNKQTIKSTKAGFCLVKASVIESESIGFGNQNMTNKSIKKLVINKSLFCLSIFQGMLMTRKI